MFSQRDKRSPRFQIRRSESARMLRLVIDGYIVEENVSVNISNSCLIWGLKLPAWSSLVPTLNVIDLW